MHQLNSKQQAAVEHTETPLLVLAGAGSGKTRVITQKIANLIQRGYASKNIVALTFTNKAAKEMKARVTSIIDKKDARQLTICTFHTLGLKILRQDYQHFGFRRSPTIFDFSDCLTVMKEIIKNQDNLKESEIILHQISTWKNNLIDENTAPSHIVDEQTTLAAACFKEYSKMMRAYNAVDFDDLILLPSKLFIEKPDVLDKWQNKIQYLLVDEYQDTNDAQYQLIKQICRFRKAFTVVGDDDQSIYAWRGAQPENLQKLQDDFDTLKVIKLEQNYRSTKNILNAANQLIANNPHMFKKNLWSNLAEGEKLDVLPCINPEDEADRITSDIISNKFQNKCRYGDVAILYRSNHQSRALEKSLRTHNIPYLISGGQSFFERKEVKDITAYLRLLINPDDDAAFLRIINVPRREIGAKLLEKIAHYAGSRQTCLISASCELGLQSQLSERQQKKLSQFTNWFQAKQRALETVDPVFLINEILDDLDYQSWISETSGNQKAAEKCWKNVMDLVGWIERIHKKNEDDIENDTQDKESNLKDIVSKMLILDIISKNTEEKDTESVQLSTMHAAKGLEFPYVYIVGMEEDVLPHSNSTEPEQIQEERRIAYVAITRAKKKLTLSYTKRKQTYQESVKVEPSRFLSELPRELLNWDDGTIKTKTPETGKKHIDSIRALLDDI